MTFPSPLGADHLQAGARLLAYGDSDTLVDVVETYGELDFEYAALRSACVMIDRPQVGIIDVLGEDRHAFLNSMVTQAVLDLPPGSSRRSFWLNRKGRVTSDLIVISLVDRLRLLVDVLTVKETIATLDAFIITEDVELIDRTPELHAIDLIGPTAGELLNLVPGAGTANGSGCPDGGHHRGIDWDGDLLTVLGHTAAGGPGCTLIGPAESVASFWRWAINLAEPFAPGAEHNVHTLDRATPKGQIRLRRAGWAAFNVARIEAGTPLMLVDFGTESLPAETGVLSDRVDFKKGCYLGQEVVARMDALGHPKQVLVAIKLRGERAMAQDGVSRQPVTGAAVWAVDPIQPGEPGKVVGRVTSSTISPLLGATAVCFAQVRWGNHEPGTPLLVEAEGASVDAVVHSGLRTMPTLESQPQSNPNSQPESNAATGPASSPTSSA